MSIEENLMRKGILTDSDTGRSYFTGYSYKTLYDWDQYFEAIVQIYMGWPSELIKNAVTIFLDHQQPSGLISRSVPSNPFHDPEHAKPFLCQIALLVSVNYGEHAWVTDPHYYDRLKKYLDYWLKDMDPDGNGLAEWVSGPHTGMDNQVERAGFNHKNWEGCERHSIPAPSGLLEKEKLPVSEGVDLNCYLYRELLAFSRIASLAGKDKDSHEYRQRALILAQLIREKLWDEQDGIFYDRCRVQGKKIPVKAVSAFTPLFCRVATPEQARRMIYEHLMNAAEFWTVWPVAALAKSEPGYSGEPLPRDVGCNWRACVWIPTNYMITHGLRYYGYGQLASLLADRTLALVRRAGNREWYLSETGEGRGLNPFWGWSLLAHFLPFEEQAPTDINDLGLYGSVPTR